MRQFTPKEIEICKKVAEKERKEIKRGDWYLYDGEIHLWDIRYKMSDDDRGKPNPVPLWQEHDCLEWLRGHGFSIIQACEHPMSHQWLVEINPYESPAYKIMGRESFDARGEFSLLEALLKAVLAILEEK